MDSEVMTDPRVRWLAQQPGKRWWRYAVIRGDGVPARLDGMWYDLDEMRHGLDEMNERLPGQWGGANLEATNQWEQRDDGAVAVVYRWLGAK